LQVKDVDVEKQEATIAYDFARLYPQSAPNHKPTPQQLLDTIKNAVHHNTHGMFSVAPLLTEPREKLRRHEIAVVVDDCKACRMFLYNTVVKVDGVQLATVDQKTGAITVWTDPTKSDLAPIRDALKKANVVFPEDVKEKDKK